jgi:uncharacterized coiled-coil protein SlyX
MQEQDIKKLQDTVRKLEERLAKLERAFASQQAAREATEVNKAVKASEASSHKFDKE